ncbi:hypothetical protein L5515_004248 [Caenorhabditis briggsae]|uniref:Protein CBR-BRD-1 n=2 Tax=Caenorhabditis briggsae TaxID=6238 RepID=A0AAE9ELA3_CAEBR|nr:hypothetical protein L5515_004248 [Caenorhabditis briggsae]
MFGNTKKALEEFQKNIVCNNCRTPKKDLQYLGSDCKHAFCWDCIGSFNQKTPGKRSATRSQCPSCSYPLNTTKIMGANMLNTCFNTLEELRQLLEQAPDLEMTQADIACTQNVFGKEQQGGNGDQEAVEKFLETQSHMPDELGQPDDEPTSTEIKTGENRENSYSPELDVFHDYGSASKSTRYSAKRPSTSTDKERKSKRSSVLKTIKKEQTDGPKFGLFDSQIPQKKHDNDLLTPFVRRHSTAPPSSAIAGFAQPFGSSKNEEEDPFTKKIVLPKRQASLQSAAQLLTKTPKIETSEEPEQFKAMTIRNRRNSIKMEVEERRSQSPMSFGEKSMSIKPEQRRSSFGTRRGEVVIINSILNNRIPQLKSAVEAGTCVNEKDNNGKTPLYVAVEQNSLEAAKILVEAGAVINASCTSSLETTLHEAVRRGNLRMAEYLLEKGASVKIRNSDRNTPEDLAKHDPKMKKLIEKYKTETRVLQPVLLPPKSRIHFVRLIDDKLLNESEKRKLPGKINLVSSEMDTPTHVVVAVDPNTQTLNVNKEELGEILKAIIGPGMVVSLDWLKACIKDTSKVDDDNLYTVRRVRWMEGETYENTIEKWKKILNKMQPKLFAGCKFYMPKPRYNFLERTSLFEIVRSAGGTASSRDSMINETDRAPYHNTSLKPNFVLYSLTHDIGDKFRDCTKYNLISEQWLIEAILSCSISTPPH